MKSLFDQLGTLELECVASLLGFENTSAGFELSLREIEPLPDNFKLGHFVIAYLEHKLNYIKKFDFETA